MSSLFAQFDPPKDGLRPLAERLRPAKLEDVIGQQHLLGEGKPLRAMVERDRLQSMILWGPPGVGKTTLAKLIAQSAKADFVPFSAVMSGMKEIKAVMAEAEQHLRSGRRTILFVDEIHRFNKAQQDAFLPYVERGDIVLIGATTENPSFEINGALLSRARVFVLEALSQEEILQVLARGLDHLGLTAAAEALSLIAQISSGDARQALTLLELAASTREDQSGELGPEDLHRVLQRRVLLYDKSGEQHYDLISALHKSVRSSDADAALYWLARMLAAGEDRQYLARRLVRMALEDIGLADPRAVEQAMACQQAVHFLGEPEGDLALAQLTIYLAVAPKSDSTYRALKHTLQLAETQRAEPVPLHLRNAPTKLMKELGYSAGYQHAHEAADAVVGMECLPAPLAGSEFFRPTNHGWEARLRERLAELKAKKQQRSTASS
ncbi:MAG: replication-associated recombination protein A [Bryobacter sp.]|nr:replication-associated recombination protein A [Bryobacter sp.]